MVDLEMQLTNQLDRNRFRVRINSARVNRIDVTCFILDVLIESADLPNQNRDVANVLEIFQDPVPFVAEIWRIHPYDRTVSIWRRQPNDEYGFRLLTGGRIQVAAIPGVWIDLDSLLA